MLDKKIQKVVVQYDDGLEQEIPVSNLPEKMLSELAAIGFEKNGTEGDSRRYLLLEWKDGWKEVVRVPGDVTELIRYFVIRRPEDKGRLVVERKDSDYPELVEIIRKPKELKRVTVV
ncbi:hypothetical protein L9W92_14105 [Pelotomaculum terephthalicicum JT]|uniref:hypothetical protein n=1 Tax=Pelotomaculum terephthalicicum TaxID=206393 RepID=UPI0009CC07F0|nr:hypothetical protein [Pelotomaculum terephthalicicum]MCG9969160.1 hypothetical protein [Pelotomaculum terephthalicicum JT]OPY61271.1 MAG: hypothetical protein A4E56_02166 [Pelotomaculum sp. PtaU1.Bin065]